MHVIMVFVFVTIICLFYYIICNVILMDHPSNKYEYMININNESNYEIEDEIHNIKNKTNLKNLYINSNKGSLTFDETKNNKIIIKNNKKNNDKKNHKINIESKNIHHFNHPNIENEDNNDDYDDNDDDEIYDEDDYEIYDNYDENSVDYQQNNNKKIMKSLNKDVEMENIKNDIYSENNLNIPYSDKKYYYNNIGTIMSGQDFIGTNIKIGDNEDIVQNSTPIDGHTLNDGMDGSFLLHNNLCSKSCCSEQYPVPFKLQYDKHVCQNKNDFIPSNYVCNNSMQDSGCLCMTKKQGNFIYNRGGNA